MKKVAFNDLEIEKILALIGEGKKIKESVQAVRPDRSHVDFVSLLNADSVLRERYRKAQHKAVQPSIARQEEALAVAEPKSRRGIKERLKLLRRISKRLKK